MNIRLYHALLLTMEENRSIFEGEVWIKDERIRYVGDGSAQDVSESCAFFGCSVKETSFGMKKSTARETC